MKALIDHLGNDDAARVTADDIVAWKNALLTPDDSDVRARSQMTVRHGYRRLQAGKKAVSHAKWPFTPT